MGNSKSVNGGFSIFDSPPEGEHDGEFSLALTSASSEARCCCLVAVGPSNFILEV